MSDEVERTPRGWIGLRRLPHDSDLRAVIVSLIVCLVCSAAISLAVSALRPYQEANRARERRARIEQIVAATPGLAALVEGDSATQLEVWLVDLETGERVEGADPEVVEAVAAARDPELGVAIPPELDVAGLGRRARRAVVYLLRAEAGLRLVVLPVEGQGYVSMMRGYLALEPDLRTIRALSFYEQSETPGLGGEIENPEWLGQWAGKRAFDADGKVRIAVDVPGGESTAADRIHRVDGISGATRTGLGVTRMLRFWLGPWGYGPTLSRLADETAHREGGETR